ncbi:MAG: oligoendopeptidase F [Peptoniphilaceae bacterium]|nr:oligoendopeptidase F [Peptoniphilaceae bacterium]MDY6019726.1 oligoendopeptidase F [Anaerococcus sp.]
MKKRNEVDIKETWKIEDLYENDQAFYKDLEKVESLSDDFYGKYKNLENDSTKIFEAISEYSNLCGMISNLENFASITTEVDTTNQDLSKRYAIFSGRIAEVYAKLSFFKSSLTKLDKKVLDTISKNNPDFAYYISRIEKKKAHLLSDDVEEVLAKLSPTFDAAYTNYADIRYGDIKIDPIEVDGEKIEINHNSFEEYLEADTNTEKRRKAFKAYHDGLRRYQSSTASVYNAQVTNEKIISKFRGYDSVFDYLLDFQDIDRKVYDKHLDTIMQELSPHMRKYAGIIKKLYKLDKMTYADLKLNIDPDYQPQVSIEEAQAYILDGLSVLGEDYGKILKKAFSDRWIDYAQNIGKRTGAFAASPYNSHPFIMTTYNNQMSQVMTLAHELGHAGHFYLANSHQPCVNTDVSMYFVESPSTTNEIIMERYLLNKAEDDRQRLWVLSTMISKTYYHNFVTHFLEASYQREVYRLIDEGKSVGSEDLNRIFKEQLEKFWKDSVELVDGAELTWMRQPHYYMGLYPYTYSAGLTIGTMVSDKVVNGTDEDRENWLEVLKAGSTLGPMDLAKKAGVDMTDTKALSKAIDFIGSIIDQIDELCQKLGMYE